ncbi:MAG: 4-alpha-glucanotransferase [Alphaproteobacteria bacterium]|nr:4-alpha-glucanotransferase [Alphaproteobacteria bacterium]
MKDVLYKKTLAKGLNTDNTDLLSVIMGPAELKAYLKGLTLKDFDDGKQLITLHTHTSVSGGQSDPKDYLKNALLFKEKYGYRNLFLAITDHDAIDALPIVLKQIQKDPLKYAGIRLVLGCELSLSYFDDKLLRPVDFELLHYGINPFDKEYAKWLAENPPKTFSRSLDEVITQFKKHKFGFLSVAHPYLIQLDGKANENGSDFLKRFFNVLKEKGVEGLEVFYMSLYQPLSHSFDKMISGKEPETETDRWVKTILDFASSHQMIKTGGTDSHTNFLAGRKRQLVLQLTEKLQKYVPLIRKGYRVLDKEITLGLPAPCMPPESAYRNTGIGSACGLGAKRIKNVLGGLFDKIQLGPMGETKEKANYSPYVSSSKINPFLIPLEKLCQDGLISTKTLNAIYDMPKTNEEIDFEQVKKAYNKALKEAYKNAKTKLSFDDFLEALFEKYQKQSDVSYIADLQVHIPFDRSKLFLKGFSLGSPADQFYEKQRNWHFKVFNPKLLFNKDGSLGPAGKAWYDVIDKEMKNAKGGLRVDHYIGFINPFVISEKSSKVSGRLYSSPNIPGLAPFVKKDFSDITKKILLAAAKKNGLKASDIYVEDLGARPPQLDGVMHKCRLGRLLIAQFWDTNDENHLYHLSKALKTDVACLDTHDLPSIQNFFKNLSWERRRAFAVGLAKDLRFNYNDSLCDLTQLVRMQWGALLASPAKRVQAFFTSWTGQDGQYNDPKHPDKWTLRCNENFDRLYFENLAKGWAYNPFDAICLAIFAHGDDFYYKNEELVHQLKAAEEDILSLAREL